MRVTVACALLLALTAGCGDAFLIRPISVQEGLEETVVDRRDGRWVWDKVLVLDIEGLIISTEMPSLFGTGERPLSLLKEKLAKAEADSNVRAVVLRINSPGGGVTASDIIYHEIQGFRERTGRPVVALMMDVAASGGYYVACGTDSIMAHPTALTGSIGVIMQWINMKGALAWIQLRVETIKSGDKKDIGSPFREMTKEERALLQQIVNAYYERFVQVVAKSRSKLPIQRVRELSDGRVYDALEAHKVGLVDGIGYMDDAIAKAKELAGITKARVVTYGREYVPKSTVYAAAPGKPTQINLLNLDVGGLSRLQQPRFMYLWAPGR